MDLLIKNGELVSEHRRYRADLLIQGEAITRIGPDLDVPDGAQVIDATGKLVFPGFIDPHVHVYMPFMGTRTRDTHATASQAALVGGTTTFIEMITPDTHGSLQAAWETWSGLAEGDSACDYSFHLGVSRWDAATEATLRELVAAGMTSFKVFLAYKGALGIDDKTLFQTLRLAQELGVIVTAHCENADLIAELQAGLLAQGKTGPEWHEPSRPVEVEADGTAHFANLLELTGARGYIVHLSSARALEQALAARARGVDLSIEVVVPHLLLDKTYAERPGIEGAKHVMSPPLRDKANQRPLWEALGRGEIDVVATDHCPFDLQQKRMGEDDFTRIPNGIASIQDRVNLLYTYGVSRGTLSLERFVEAASTRPAKLFGLYPRKGTLTVGSDADVVVFDPFYRGQISAESTVVNIDYNVFEGRVLEGRASTVIFRGEVAAQDGRFVGELGRGRLLRR